MRVEQKRNYKKHTPGSFRARRDRWDIYNNLPYGAMSMIARKVEVPPSLVHDVLYGRVQDWHNIIPLAERIAALNIWKQRFCRFPSEIPEEWAWGDDYKKLKKKRKRKKE
jgi:hypothetical protein